MNSNCRQNYFANNNSCGIPQYYLYYHHYQPNHFQPYVQQKYFGYEKYMFPNEKIYHDYNNCWNFPTLSPQYNSCNNSSPIKNNPTPVMMSTYNNCINKDQIVAGKCSEFIRENLRRDNQNSNNRFINGIKNIVNGFFHPKSSCDFNSEHHWHCDPKYKNGYMKKGFANSTQKTVIDTVMIKNRNSNSTSKQQVKTITSGIDVENKNKIFTPSHKNFSNHNNSINKQELEKENNMTAIFSSDDFPELPTPKQSFWSKSKYRNKTSNRSPPSSRSSSFHKKDRIKNENIKYEENLKDSKYINSQDNFVIIDKLDTLTSKEENSKTIPSSTTSSQSPSNHNLENININKQIALHKTNCNRTRQLSECSDDSFVICFTEDAAEGVIECFNIDDDDDDDYDNGNYDDDDDDLKSNNSYINTFYNNEDNDDDNNYKEYENIENSSIKTDKYSTDNFILERVGDNQPDSGFDDQNEKKVRFNLKPEVHVMHVWNYAYRAARKSNWEDYARDRSRFKHRIDSLEVILNPILEDIHRNKIYRERFCDNENCLTNS